MFASFFTLMTSAITVDATRMSSDSIYDQFVCRIWVTQVPLYALLVTSTYGILATAFDRYIAVVYPIWYYVSLIDLLCSVPVHTRSREFCSEGPKNRGAVGNEKPKGMGYGEGCPLCIGLRTQGSVVSLPSRTRGGTAVENEFYRWRITHLIATDLFLLHI